MTDTTMSAEPPRLRVGAVFSRAVDLLFADFGKFFLLGLVAFLPFLIVSLLLGVALLPGVGFVRPGTIAPGSAVFGSALAAVMMGAGVILSEAMILYGAFQRMRGQGFAFGASLRLGLGRLLPIIGMYILMEIAILIGLVLLIVPGVMLAVMFYVALPACVIEEKNPIASLSRSVELTKGNRWRVFGIIIVLTLGNLIGQNLIQLLLLAVGGVTASALGVFLWYVVVGAFTAVLVAVIYHDLRVAHEGIDIERIAAVFD